MAKSKKTQKRNVTRATAHIRATFNNTLITITDADGNTVCWSSAGKMGFRGSKKGTSYAAQQAAINVAHQARQFGVQVIDVLLKGPGAGRESAVRSLEVEGIQIASIKDITGVPHNGCRPRKRRRV